ncbi:OmpA family protein [Diaphorobacter sp. HDW4B]|uniref:OmpA family protein n=1 Tax=Diaphorobacter sp. HDW4B TaxID=2714925 RepID=UPI00140A5B5F|nr:OmpA family protein [Diaphorobacter sp. HDW4B]QIL73086.1 OmpA family protein [Diaphorobacter sp. HDW4B]
MQFIHALVRLLPVVLAFSVTASGAQSLVSSATSEELISALGGDEDGGLPSKAFRRTAAPDAATHACPEAGGSDTAASAGSTSRNLSVVYAGDVGGAPPPSVNLSIQFATGSDRILPTSNVLLANLATALKAPSMANARVAVAGHTDATGSRATNLQLSCARAIAVRNHLILQGVAPDRLGAYGFGPDKPLQLGAVESAVNRRVEIRRAN